jgi:tetratricopeptide (TPR) repeat protein
MRALTVGPTAMQPYDYVLLGEHRPATSAEENLRARQDYLRAIEIDPACAPAWAGLAHSHAIEGLFVYSRDYEACLDAALAAAMQACDRGPRDAKAAWVLGHALSLRGEAAAALKAFERAERLAPRDADLLVMKGMALQFAGRPEQAMAAHRRALRLNFDPPGWHLWNAAAAAYQCRAYDQALALLEPFIAQRPSFLRPRYSLAAAYAQVGRRADAERAIAPILADDPAASLANEYARARLIGMPIHMTDHWLEGLAHAGLRS